MEASAGRRTLKNSNILEWVKLRLFLLCLIHFLVPSRSEICLKQVIKQNTLKFDYMYWNDVVGTCPGSCVVTFLHKSYRKLNLPLCSHQADCSLYLGLLVLWWFAAMNKAWCHSTLRVDKVRYVNPYIPHKPLRRLKWPYAFTRLTSHLCVARYLIWWFASWEKVWSYMALKVLTETRCH